MKGKENKHGSIEGRIEGWREKTEQRAHYFSLKYHNILVPQKCMLYSKISGRLMKSSYHQGDIRGESDLDLQDFSM